MTDEERKKLCDELRLVGGYMEEMAADEIEHLVDITAQYKKLSKYLCTIIRQKLIDLEEIEND